MKWNFFGDILLSSDNHMGYTVVIFKNIQQFNTELLDFIHLFNQEMNLSEKKRKEMTEKWNEMKQTF